jgi:hypothetical protein
VLGAPALAQNLELRPLNPAAIYEPGATVGWTVVPRGAHAGGAYPFTAPHNHQATPEQQQPYVHRQRAWLDALVRGDEPEVRSHRQ